MGGDAVVLRHRDTRNQSIMFGSFGLLLLAIPVTAFLTDAPPKWWLLLLLPLGLLAAYSSLRLATLRVILDDTGVREPAPLRPTVVTPWDDVVRVRRTEEKGAIGLSFFGVSIEHKGGWKHQLIALNITTRDPRAETTVDEWILAIREGKRSHSG